jgi:hypothetical protein
VIDDVGSVDDVSAPQAGSLSVESYEIVLPPGWVQHPVERGIAGQLFKHVQRIVEPTGNQQLIDVLRSTIYKAMRELRENGGIDVFLPEDSRSGTPIPAALISNSVNLGDSDVPLAVRRITHGRETREIDTLVGTAYRWESPTTGQDTLAGLESGNIHYLFPLPGEESATAVMFTFSVLQAEQLDDEYLEILVMIFDAMMNSLIWNYRESA